MVTKSFQLTLVVALVFVLGACGIKPPVDDATPPRASVIVSDSTYNLNDKFSYMRYDSSGPGPAPFAGVIGQRTETGFVTKDGAVNFRVGGADVGGVKSVIVRAKNGTITPGTYTGAFPVSLEVTTEGDTDVFIMTNTSKYAFTPLDHTVSISPKTDNPEVLVNVEVLDMGGISGRSNSTSTPEIIIAFSTQ